MVKIRVQAKCSDMCGIYLIGDPNHQQNTVHDGYVPKELGIGGGDYISFEIDLETGQIVGWKKPSDEALDKVFGTDT